MPVHLYASLPHYAEHLVPIWEALPAEVRGHAWAPRTGCWWGKVPGGTELRATMREPVMVAGYGDYQHMPYRPVIYVEHGAGQTYEGDVAGRGNSSYAGGRGLERVVLFIAPGPLAGGRWRAEYRAAVAEVGCPKLDPWLTGSTVPARDTARPTVAVTFHWDCPLVPETRTALPHYKAHLAPLVAAVAAAGGRVIGHGHPRAWGHLARLWQELGVPAVQDFSRVLDVADLLIGDNTSALPEFASTGRPVLCLNAPWYRREVHHGLRFWDLVPGLQVDQPEDLEAGVWAALADPPDLTRVRQEAVAAVYSHLGGAAGRAAAAILEVLNAQPQAAHQVCAGGAGEAQPEG